MPVSYTVQQGDHFSRIAEQFGFTDYRTIWNDPANARLKQKRDNPNVLLPGDVVVIPDRKEKDESRGTDSAHKFQVAIPKLKLRLKLENLYENPLANRPYRLTTQEGTKADTTTGSGQLEQPIPKSLAAASLQTIPFDDIKFVIEVDVLIGHLNPVTEVSGWAARLNNLGYNASDDVLPPPEPGQKAEDQFQGLPPDQKAQLLSAIEEFQCDHQLTVDGKCGPSTQAKLKEVHGC